MLASNRQHANRTISNRWRAVRLEQRNQEHPAFQTEAEGRVPFFLPPPP